MLSFYEILQVEEDASTEEIKRAYRKLSKVLHPDLNNNSKESTVMFNLLHEAYETLSDPVKRSQYNSIRQYSSTANYTNTTYEAYRKDDFNRTEQEEEETSKWTKFLLALFVIVGIGIIVLLVMIPNIWWFFIILIGTPIWFIYKLFKT